MTSEDLRRTVQGIMRSASAHGGAVFASDIDYGVDPSMMGTPRPTTRP